MKRIYSYIQVTGYYIVPTYLLRQPV